MHGNTSINPFFYGTFLGETKPGEPVTRTKKQAFQADAVGVAHQLTPAHFNRTHTFRLEWQPGPGGRIDWFSKGHRINSTFSMEGDGLGKDWVHAYGLRDESISSLMGSMIPIEPMYLIMNTAVSHTWGFPAPCPEGCKCTCYECGNPDCACALPTGYCDNMPASFEIDHVRVYQSVNSTKHSLGCSPRSRPTETFIKGHSERYTEPGKKRPLEPVQNGGGLCLKDSDCGGPELGSCSSKGHCVCEDGQTGPTCLAHSAFYLKEDTSIEAIKVQSKYSILEFIHNLSRSFSQLLFSK